MKKRKLKLNRETVADLSAARGQGGIIWSLVLLTGCNTNYDNCGSGPTVEYSCGPSNVGCPYSIAYTACDCTRGN